MFNRPLSPFHVGEPASDWEIDGHPRLRLCVLYALFLVALLAISARLVHVQTRLGDEYAAEFTKTTERFEAIPTRDGRILSDDGQVLAEDVELFGLKVHYRWLEEPADGAWIRQQALARLDRPSRRSPQRVAAEEAALLKARQELWRRLERLSGLDHAEFQRRRNEIQHRVETIYALVERRRAANASPESDLPLEESGPSAMDPWWRTAGRTLVSALTTPPRREAQEPLVIREQLDYHLLLAEIPLETAVEIEAHPERFPGTRIDMRTRRVYPQGETAAHLIGNRALVDDEALRARHERLPQPDPLDYQPGDRAGRTGLERYYERHLRGLRGERKVVFNRRGELIHSEVVREPRYGRDLELSLHLPLQQAAEALLDEQLRSQAVDETTGKPLPIPPGGAIVALDIRTGAVLAAASAPRFDLEKFASGDPQLWRQLLADPRKPLFHRAAEMALPPGSVFKVVSAIAFLETGQLDPEREFFCQGYLDRPDRLRCFTFRNFGVGHGEVNLVSALARSCNVYFFSAARRIGAPPLHEWAARFGFGQPTGIDLPGESSGNLPRLHSDPRAGARHARKKQSVSGDALQLAIGQARLTATPLQVARLMAAIANGGRMVTPRLVDTLESDAAGEASASASTEAAPIAELSARSLEWVRLGLRQVVAHPQGTGYKMVRLRDVAIAGKTGTAEAGGGKPDHAWFAGYVPADRPRIAFVVVLEHAGPGGHAAGPVAREFVQAVQALGLLDGMRPVPPSAN
jgi:penicillin-binding protein 2